jgi:hypothetical protein
VHEKRIRSDLTDSCQKIDILLKNVASLAWQEAKF